MEFIKSNCPGQLNASINLNQKAFRVRTSKDIHKFIMIEPLSGATGRSGSRVNSDNGQPTNGPTDSTRFSVLQKELIVESHENGLT